MLTASPTRNSNFPFEKEDSWLENETNSFLLALRDSPNKHDASNTADLSKNWQNIGEETEEMGLGSFVRALKNVQSDSADSGSAASENAFENFIRASQSLSDDQDSFMKAAGLVDSHSQETHIQQQVKQVRFIGRKPLIL